MLSKICYSIVLLLCPIFLLAQVPAKPTPTVPAKEKDDEVLRVNTNLIQTGISVFDKKGNFVEGLKQDDFQLRVDGKPVTTQFFDQISIKNPKFESRAGQSAGQASAPATRDAARTLVFVVDDMHLSAESLIRTRTMILKFVDEQMLPTDRIAVVSSGGKVGFLQQFTGDKAMLRAAANRLIYNRDMSSNDFARPPMNEYDAQSIDRLDRDVLNYFIKETATIYRVNPSQANSMVQARVRAILSRTQVMTSTTLSALEASVRAAGLFRGRKAIYFVTDGFLLDPGNSDTSDRLHQITDAAARSNTVIYSFDAKGLDASMPASENGEPPPPIAFSLQAGARFETQDGPAYVANNTGGQFIHNTNDLQTALNRITTEAFTYYLLAWEPEAEITKSNKFRRIEVSVTGRPELKVRVQNGYLPSNAVAKTEVEPVKGKSTSKNNGVVQPQPVTKQEQPVPPGL
ncbi:MAG TPA: VWA domain-containing protein, partial [Pyrinomonadaceae bacterium]|nr:VWA domain-containing protein [Pyrinomonadaceae bacterium]